MQRMRRKIAAAGFARIAGPEWRTRRACKEADACHGLSGRSVYL